MLSDEFILKSDFKDNKIEMKAYIKRNISEDGLQILVGSEIEELEYQTITLFEGVNYIYTNYIDADIEAVYPKNNDLNNRYLSNSLFNEHLLNTSELSSSDLYFKDAFTNTEDGINISANNLEIGCITSKDNAFSIDSDGNLSVNSITSVEEINAEIDYNEIIDLVYPVGSIYLSVNSLNPSLLFGGSWVSWGSGRAPFGVDEAQSEFSTVEKTGGSKTHTHTSASHSHSLNGANAHAAVNKYAGKFYMKGRDTSSWASTDSLTCAAQSTQRDNDYSADVFGSTQATTPEPTGSSSTLPPYITCFMWKRTS